MINVADKELKSIQNPWPGRDYEVSISIPEFTCVCPKTGQPDFAEIRIKYIPDKLCIELKSLKLYIWSYRDQGAFHEDVTNRILEDIVKTIEPKYLEVVGDFNIRGGIKTVVTARYKKESKEDNCINPAEK